MSSFIFASRSIAHRGTSTLKAVGDGAVPGGFAWWDPHGRAVRRSRALFALGVCVTASYAASPFLVAAVILSAEGSWPHIGAVGVGLVLVAVLAVVSGVVAMVAWRGLPAAVLRLSGARRPTSDERRIAAAGTEPFALARGMAPPTIWVVDDRSTNALAWGRPNAAHVCFTKGALHLPDDEFAALCAFELTALTCRPFAYCTAAIDLVLFAEWCTRVLWQLAALALLSAVVGVPAYLAAGVTASIAVLVAVTRLALVVADRALPRLLDDAAQLVDLEAVRLTEEPAVFSRLLSRLLDDHHRVRTRWQIAHLWFERDEIEVPRPRRGGFAFVMNLVPFDIEVPALARRYERSNPRGMQDRVRRALDQANGVGSR
jgi:hypothetical protein